MQMIYWKDETFEGKGRSISAIVHALKGPHKSLNFQEFDPVCRGGPDGAHAACVRIKQLYVQE